MGGQYASYWNAFLFFWGGGLTCESVHSSIECGNECLLGKTKSGSYAHEMRLMS